MASQRKPKKAKKALSFRSVFIKRANKCFKIYTRSGAFSEDVALYMEDLQYDPRAKFEIELIESFRNHLVEDIDIHLDNSLLIAVIDNPEIFPEEMKYIHLLMKQERTKL